MNAFATFAKQSRLAYLALGSNLGNRAENIRRAVRALESFGRIRETSFLYENPPAYVREQGAFLNAACAIETSLSPLDLLDAVKSVERDLGRMPTFVNGPRLIDVDIVMYENVSMRHETLTLPHPRMHERDFVLQPLADLNPSLMHPLLSKTVLELLSSLNSGDRSLRRVAPRRRNSNELFQWGERTYIMGIINCTPDSFSDGGQYKNCEEAIDRCVQMLEQEGADMIDIGGESTRPGAASVDPDVEIQRVIPVIEGVRRQSKGVISVDTMHAEVARAAVEAGADIVNDVSAGFADHMMTPAVAEMGVPLITMHMRGNPATMQTMTYYDGNVIESVSTFLKERSQIGEQQGVPRWNQILDPGLGFAKTAEQNIQILRELRVMKERLSGFPLLVGPSRKAFLGQILHKQQPRDRDYGTAGAVCAAIKNGADIVRVHNVSMMRDAVRVYDALVRHSS
mmetsp:Transcript_17899/g.29406  ORF Transcript_17899/g.29406 Transcript_17899/m.29406 type:complete len:455 (+) Transcript_17899:98-1462(+)